jgi:hypothetical protein
MKCEARLEVELFCVGHPVPRSLGGQPNDWTRLSSHVIIERRPSEIIGICFMARPPRKAVGESANGLCLDTTGPD